MKHLILMIMLVASGFCQERIFGDKEVISTIQIRIIIPSPDQRNETNFKKETSDNVRYADYTKPDSLKQNYFEVSE